MNTTQTKTKHTFGYDTADVIRWRNEIERLHNVNAELVEALEALLDCPAIAHSLDLSVLDDKAILKAQQALEQAKDALRKAGA